MSGLYRFNNENFLPKKARLFGKHIQYPATIVAPATIYRWHRKLVARKFDSSKVPRKPGRPKISDEIEQLILKFARKNKSSGYNRIAGALENLDYDMCPSSVANIMKRNGLNPYGDRTKGDMSWREFIRLHRDVLWGNDFFTTEVWTPSGTGWRRLPEI